MTTTGPTRRALTIIGQLMRKAQTTQKTVILRNLSSEIEVQNLIEEEHKNFGAETVTLLHNNTSKLFNFGRETTMSVDGLVAELHSRLKKIGKLESNKKTHQPLTVATGKPGRQRPKYSDRICRRKQSVIAIATSLQNAYGLEGLPAASVTTLGPFCSDLTHLKFIQSVRSNYRCKSTNACTYRLFYTFLSVNHNNQTSSAILDTDACGFVVRQNTLDEAMSVLNIKELDAKKIDQTEHLFR